MDAAVIADFDDEEAYRDWVADPGHHEVRSRYLDPIRARRDRILFRIWPGGPSAIRGRRRPARRLLSRPARSRAPG